MISVSCLRLLTEWYQWDSLPLWSGRDIWINQIYVWGFHLDSYLWQCIVTFVISGMVKDTSLPLRMWCLGNNPLDHSHRSTWVAGSEWADNVRCIYCLSTYGQNEIWHWRRGRTTRNCTNALAESWCVASFLPLKDSWRYLGSVVKF